MSILILRRPRAGPRGRMLRMLRDRRAQVEWLIISVDAAIKRCVRRSRQRWALYEIAERDDHHLLKDIGVSREEAFREAGKPFWRQ